MTSSSPWTDAWFFGLGQLRDQAVALMPKESGAAYTRLLDASCSYMHLAEVFQGLLEKAMTSGDAWREAVQEGMREYAVLSQRVGENGFAEQDAWAGFAEKWGVPKDAWETFLPTVPGMPANMSEALSGARTLEDALERLLSGSAMKPAVGLAREHQESFLRWTRLNKEYTDACMQYVRFLGQAHAKALENIGRKLASVETAEQGPDTMRRLYDLYVDCGEEVYGTLAHDRPYLDAQTRMTNALMALRKHEREWMQDVLGMRNVPGRREMNAVMKRLQSVRRDLRTLKDRVQALDERSGDEGPRIQWEAFAKEMEALREREQRRDREMAALKKQLDELKATPSAQSPATAGTKAPARKKVVSKGTAKRAASGKKASGKPSPRVLEIPAAAATVKKAVPKATGRKSAPT